MSEKILFWLDAEYIHFGIAKYLQEEENYELYAIFDFNHHLKKNFERQHVVEFKKSWFFWDYVSQKIGKYDME